MWWLYCLDLLFLNIVSTSFQHYNGHHKTKYVGLALWDSELNHRLGCPYSMWRLKGILAAPPLSHSLVMRLESWIDVLSLWVSNPYMVNPVEVLGAWLCCSPVPAIYDPLGNEPATGAFSLPGTSLCVSSRHPPNSDFQIANKNINQSVNQ